MKTKLNFQKVADQVVKKTPGLVAGAMASNFIANGIDKLFKGKATPMITAGLTIAAGAILPGVIGSGNVKKDNFLTCMADGIMAQGGLKLAKAFGMPGISGYNNTSDVGDVDTVDDYSIPEDTADVSGYNDTGGDIR